MNMPNESLPRPDMATILVNDPSTLAQYTEVASPYERMGKSAPSLLMAEESRRVRDVIENPFSRFYLRALALYAKAIGRARSGNSDADIAIKWWNDLNVDEDPQLEMRLVLANTIGDNLAEIPKTDESVSEWFLALQRALNIVEAGKTLKRVADKEAAELYDVIFTTLVVAKYRDMVPSSAVTNLINLAGYYLYKAPESEGLISENLKGVLLPPVLS